MSEHLDRAVCIALLEQQLGGVHWDELRDRCLDRFEREHGYRPDVSETALIQAVIDELDERQVREALGG